MTCPRRCVLLTLAFLAGVPSPAPAAVPPAASPSPTQTSQATPSDIGDLIEHVDVEVVNVDVVVTDKQGRPVRDLKRDDFTMKVDGRPIPIDFFAPPPAAAPPPPAAPRDVRPDLAVDLETSAERPAPQPLTVVLYVDQAALQPGPRGISLTGLGSFVDKHMPAGSRVIVAAYERNLRILAGPTEDRNEVHAALAKLKKMVPPGLLYQVQQRALISDIQTTSRDAGPTVEGMKALTKMQVDALAEQQALDQRNAFRSLSDLLGTLTGSEGRVVLLLASGGFVTRPGAHLADIWAQAFGATEDSSEILSGTGSVMDYNAMMLRGELTRLLRVAQASRVTVYAIDSTDLDVGGPDPEELESTVTTSMKGSMAALEASGNLRGLAIATGGRAFRATPDLATDLAIVENEIDSSYSLGFSAGPEMREGFHTIAVEVRRPALKVRHREGFRRRSEDERATDAALSAATLGSGSNPFGIAVATGEAKAAPNKKLWMVPVVVQVPLHALTLVPQGEKQSGKVGFHYVLRDAENHVVTFESRSQAIEIPTAGLQAALAKHISYSVTMPLARGEYHVAVTVRDEIGNRVSTVVVPVSVSKK